MGHWVCHHKNTQHQPLRRSTILILARQTLVGMGSTRILIVIWWRRSSSRTSVSHTPNKPVGTQNQMYKNCTGVIETNIERVCFDVNELVCDLVEAIHYETLEETYQVQRCFTGKD